ncbi:hypothetical protein QAD02_009894 [Eretmocerus hayati]|uniref:Uncharacterized protein n=1 Tax=Eretmocerus hayati TaxID=131215 RepID=A0ACC2NC03_9HYME|nr:hypothetical protein QAD02_009894 [Eretmocerus hayati]
MDDGMDVEAAEKEADEMESEESEEDRGRRIDEKVSRVREELFGCLFAESTKLDKAECREIISKFAKMEELLNEERRHLATLEGRLDESRRERLHLRNSLATQTIIERSMREGPCMSEENKGTQAKRGAVTPVQAQAPPLPPPGPIIQGNRTKNRGAPAPRPPSVPSYALVLKQADGVSDQDALAKVKKCVLESRSVNVKGMRVARSGGVVIELASDLEKKKVRMSGMFMSESMNVLEPRAPRPQLIVFDIPNELLGDGLIEEIRRRNFPEMALETFRDQVRVVTTVAQRKEARKRGGKDEEVSNVVLEVSVGMRERMLKKEKVYVGWVCSKVRESVNVPRCWKCMEYGHGIDECKKKERLCRRCGRPGHLMAACRDAERCVNCAKQPGSRNIKHSAMSPNCPDTTGPLHSEFTGIDSEIHSN